MGTSPQKVQAKHYRHEGRSDEDDQQIECLTCGGDVDVDSGNERKNHRHCRPPQVLVELLLLMASRSPTAVQLKVNESTTFYREVFPLPPICNQHTFAAHIYVVGREWL